MGIMKDRRPIESHQLYAIARVILVRYPAASDAEWKAAVLDSVSKQGYDEPRADMLASTLASLEHQLHQTGWRRPPPIPEPAAATTPAQPPAPSEPTRQEWAAMVATVSRILERSGRSYGVQQLPPDARERLGITEHAALDQFYAEVNVPCADKLAVLKRFAELAIVRESGWDYGAVRAASGNHHLIAYQCFGCGGSSTQVAMDWHHIIQIQHGGSNLLRNRVALCGVCHAAVHPWMSKRPRPKGFMSLFDIAHSILDDIE